MKISKTKSTLGEWLVYWFEVYKKPILSKSSIENIERVIRLHLPEELKAEKLKDLHPADIDEALVAIRSTRMRKYSFHVLNNSLNKAYRLDLIKEDIMKKAEAVRHRQKQSRPLTHEEQAEFIKAIEKSPQRELFLFYLYTGVRRTEALRLEWRDIDFQRKTIHIRGTKSATSDRVLYLIPEVEELLQRQRAKALPGERVFPWSCGYIDQVFKRLCPNHHLHDLRHTFITRCAESGININVAQSLAGHSDIKVTLQVYTHVSAAFQKSEYTKFKL